MKQYHVAMPYFSDKDISWIQEKVGEVMRGILSTGPYVKELEKKFADMVGTKFAVCVNTCTSALEISLKALGLKAGDEVIVPTETFIATGMAVTLNGGKIVFAEVDPNTFCLTLDEIKKRMTLRTKGVMLVHFGGYMSADTIKIRDFCKKKKLFLIEDAAHAHGSSFKGKMAGSIGDTGCFSFFSTKIMTMGEGGILTTNSKKIYDYAVSQRERGRKINSTVEIYSFPGRSCRVPEISAVLGLNQLSHLKESLKVRNVIASVYDKVFKGSEDIVSLKAPKEVKNAYWKHISLIKNRKISRDKLAAVLRNDFGIRINWAYDPPLHLQPVYRNIFKTKKGDFPITEDAMSRHIHLPMHVGITRQDAKYIAQSILKAIEKVKK